MKSFLLIVSLLAVSVSAGIQSASAQTDTYTLDNGMTIILKENHSSPMVASLVFVKSGSAYEGKFENGITHFLEHLLFDGTTSLTREELDRSISDLGGYINAFTRKDLTAYLVLLPKQYINYGMTVQADMLFNSVIPEDELAKERKVVIEEINRDFDSPGAPADEFFTEHAYGSTAYGRPVLGYRAFIENIPREAIIDYWKTYYRPANMITLVIGDFDSAEMKKTVASVFGQMKNPEIAATPPELKSEPLVGKQRFDTVSAVTSTHINFSFQGPAITDPGYLPFDLLAHYLNLEEVSPLHTALVGAEPLATEVSVYLTPYEGFSRLELTVVSESPENRDTIVATVLQQMQAISAHSADAEALAGIKTSVKTQDIYNAEKLHYYGFMIAPTLMTGGWDFIQQYPSMLDKVTWEQTQQAAHQWLDDPNYVVTVIRPIDDSSKPAFRAKGLTADEVKAHFAAASFMVQDLEAGPKLTYPPTDAVALEITDRAVYHRAVLDNGLTVLVKSSPDSKVFAVNALGKNRLASEPVDKAGITDFVNRCLEKGSTTKSGAELSRALAKIGANVTLYDNPYIPYDDRYTTPMFSFFKFETIDDFAADGFALFSDMLKNPAFDSTEVEKVRQAMTGVIMREAGAPGTVAKQLFYSTLFEGKAYAKQIMGTAQTISAISPADLKEYHAKFYAPDNVILAIATSRDTAEVMTWVREQFGSLPKGNLAASATAPEPLALSREEHQELAKEQISIYLGAPLPGAMSPEAVPLELSLGILSDRLYGSLRERQGLAYSVGAGSFFDKDFGWYYCAMGTSADKYHQAYEGIKLEIDKLRLDGPSEAELKRARNQVWGRLMSAKLSRINQAYYMAVNEYLGRTPAHDSEYLANLSKVTLMDMGQVIQKYIRPETVVLATAGKRGGD